MAKIIKIVWVLAICLASLPAVGQDSGSEDLLSQVKTTLEKSFLKLRKFKLEYKLQRELVAVDRRHLFEDVNPGFWESDTFSYLYSDGKYEVSRKYSASNVNAEQEYLPPVPCFQEWAFNGRNLCRSLYDDGVVTGMVITPVAKLPTTRDAPMSRVDFLRLAGIWFPNRCPDHADPIASSSVLKLFQKSTGVSPEIERLANRKIRVVVPCKEKSVEICLDQDLGMAINSLREFDLNGSLLFAATMSNFVKVHDDLWLPQFCRIERYRDSLVDVPEGYDSVLFTEEVSVLDLDSAPDIGNDAFEMSYYKPGLHIGDANLGDNIYEVPCGVSDLDAVIADLKSDGQQDKPPFELFVWLTRLAIGVGVVGCCWLGLSNARNSHVDE